jgi:hypothetical protein
VKEGKNALFVVEARKTTNRHISTTCCKKLKHELYLILQLFEGIYVHFRLIMTSRYRQFELQFMAALHPTVDVKALKPYERFVALVIIREVYSQD